jgi:hypothetical protein
MSAISLEYAVVRYEEPETTVFRGATPAADVGGGGGEGTLSVEKVEASPHEVSELQAEDTVRALRSLL